MHAFIKIIRDNRGVGAIEYALVASLISIAAISAFGELGTKSNAKMTSVDTALTGRL